MIEVKSADRQNKAARKDPLERFLQDDLLFEGVLRKAYKKKVVFNDFLQELAVEMTRALGQEGPSIIMEEIRLKILASPFRETFFHKLARVAQT